MKNDKKVADKMGIRKGARALLIAAPEDVVQAIQLPELDLKSRPSGEFDYIHLFVKTQAMFVKKFPNLKSYLKQTGSLWVSWPKSKQLDTDLSITTVIKLGYDYGLVESKTLSINATWSAIKFTHPKAGRKYNNSYGKLKL